MGGSLALWPMIKPDGHSAGAKRVELHPSGSWCNDIRNVISVLVCEKCMKGFQDKLALVI